MSAPLLLPSLREADFAILIDQARRGAAPEDVASLAMHLANSGERLSWELTHIADVASTGGPGSLSTLLTPFALVAAGYNVVKLGVTGRPAGAIDVLGTIPGYRTRLNADEVRAVLARSSFAHFLADERFCPLDAALFAYRKRVGAVAVPVLAAASLLAKKIAVGVTHVGLDVRVGRHGNFGVTPDAARSNALMFCAAAKSVGISAVAFLTDAERVPQPWIGRGESLLGLAQALRLGQSMPISPWAESHFRDCYRMAAYTTRSDVTSPIDSESITRLARQALDSHLLAQGSSIDAFLDRIDAVLASPLTTIRAHHRGLLTLDLDLLRAAIVAAQERSGSTFGDPVGLELLVRPGAGVEEGEALARLRTAGDEIAASSIRSAFKVVVTDPTDLMRSIPEVWEIVRV